MTKCRASTTKVTWTRTRSGCLDCRRRKRKCDGAQPQCQNCRVRGDQCCWGLKASFHPSRTLKLSSEDRAALVAIEEQRDNAATFNVQILDNTEQIVREYHCDQRIELLPHALSPGTETSTREFVESACSGEESLDTSLNPSPEGINAHDTHIELDHEAPTLPFVAPFSLGQAISSNQSSLSGLELPVSRVEQCRLISAFLQETGTWCETTDSDMHFTVASVHRMMENEAFTAAAMALTSRQIDSMRHCQRQATLGLYQHVIQLLIHQDPAQADEAILATCTLLCVYEMMASNVSEWRRHLKGCAGLLKSKNWNGSSQGIVNACFWAFARIDVWAAFMIGEETLMPTAHWVGDSDVKSVAAAGAIDAYCNLANLIFAKIVNFLAEIHKRPTTPTNTSSMVNSLWDELQEWRTYRPKEAHPLLRSEKSQSGPFQTIIYSHSSSICGATFYHSGSILLLQTGCVWQYGTNAETYQGVEKLSNGVYHELGGISTSNTSHANWVNQLQPLYIAGQAFCNDSNAFSNAEDGRKDEDEHLAEKIALLKHLARIERETGWKTFCRAAELRKLWGFG